MTNEWKERILGLRHRTTEEQDLEFVSLVNEAENNCDLETCRILISTFVTEDDFGVQESVNRVLSTAIAEDRQLALLKDLQRLEVEAPEWTEVLIETEMRFHLTAFKSTVQVAKPEIRAILDRFLLSPNLQEYFPKGIEE